MNQDMMIYNKIMQEDIFIIVHGLFKIIGDLV